MPIHLISSTKLQQTHISLWDYVGLIENKPLSVAINHLITSSPISMQYFSHRYFTILGGNILAEGLTPFASKYALSERNQRLKVSALTPAACASSYLLHAFIARAFYLPDEIQIRVVSHFYVHTVCIALPSDPVDLNPASFRSLFSLLG